MSRLTTDLTRSAPGIVMCASFAAAGVAISTPKFPFDADGYRSGTTIYPLWVWALVLGGVIAGAVCAAPSSRAVKSAGAGIGLVAAMQLAGTGIVGRKHMEPAFGMGGGYGNGDIGELQTMAVLIALSAVVGGLASVSQLLAAGALTSGVDAWRSALSALIGIAVIVALPLVIKGGDYNAGDLTSWGAIGLIYAGPWGAAIVATAWLDRVAALAVLVGVCGSVLLAVAGPQMTDLLNPEPTGPFAVSLVAPLLVLATRIPVGTASALRRREPS